MAAELPPDWTKMKPEFAAEAVDSAIEKSRANIAAIKALPTEGSITKIAFWRSIRRPSRSTPYTHVSGTSFPWRIPTPCARRTARSSVKSPIFIPPCASTTDSTQSLRNTRLPPKANPSKARARGCSRRLCSISSSAARSFRRRGSAGSAKSTGLLAQKAQKFSENVLDDTKRFTLHIGDPSRLEGLPPAAVAVAAQKAVARGESGWDFTLEQPSYVPFMSYAADDSLREKLWRASARLASDGEYSNWGLMEEILRLRAEKARILGRADFADLVLERRMARSGAKALAFVEDLRGKFSAAFETEWRELLDFSRSRGPARRRQDATVARGVRLRKAAGEKIRVRSRIAAPVLPDGGRNARNV